MGTGLHRYDITFEGGIAILEGPMACLMFAQHLKTSVFAVAQMDLNSTGSPTLKKEVVWGGCSLLTQIYGLPSRHGSN
jgi:hypothetical protein